MPQRLTASNNRAGALRRVRLPLLFAGLAELGEREAGGAYAEQAKGGKRQVPCLFIDGKPLYESSDIIAWFEQNA